MKKIFVLLSVAFLALSLDSCKKEDSTSTGPEATCPYYLTGENCDKALRNLLVGTYYGHMTTDTDPVGFGVEPSVYIGNAELNTLYIMYCDATFDKDLNFEIPLQDMPDSNTNSNVKGSGYFKGDSLIGTLTEVLVNGDEINYYFKAKK
ncbi:MAG TPA: hypothetical protein VIL57_07915 [Bacteroidia bacterium]